MILGVERSDASGVPLRQRRQLIGRPEEASVGMIGVLLHGLVGIVSEPARSARPYLPVTTVYTGLIRLKVSYPRSVDWTCPTCYTADNEDLACDKKHLKLGSGRHRCGFQVIAHEHSKAHQHKVQMTKMLALVLLSHFDFKFCKNYIWVGSCSQQTAVPIILPI